MTHVPGVIPITKLPEDGGNWISSTTALGFQTDIEMRTHALIADEPVSLGGTDRGPTPYEYLLGALGSCMAMTLRMYANRKAWPLERVTVRLRTARSHERDCENCETTTVGVGELEREIDLVGPLNDDQRRRLLLIADRCPVKQTLERGIKLRPASTQPNVDAGR